MHTVSSLVTCLKHRTVQSFSERFSPEISNNFTVRLRKMTADGELISKFQTEFNFLGHRYCSLYIDMTNLITGIF